MSYYAIHVHINAAVTRMCYLTMFLQIYWGLFHEPFFGIKQTPCCWMECSSGSLGRGAGWVDVGCLHITSSFHFTPSKWIHLLRSVILYFRTFSCSEAYEWLGPVRPLGDLALRLWNSSLYPGNALLWDLLHWQRHPHCGQHRIPCRLL